ncbi:hypothetical protein NSK_006119 [Nannochloropsis salina CCMP1776]|uniref:Uncharacterized protein n=1 Tax=Nannochloropsis salina CCMP1776 TaxID=1027361 RepID=A0A4D9CZ85_9STRA|nr:hypothetical protein NSK_006119 [Nannochloropsis salina CCMP1776]|eukprot:TFJ82695.1 hypothetical protein NSK_006119 [Nannochloropsis salina CCMP1776]
MTDPSVNNRGQTPPPLSFALHSPHRPNNGASHHQTSAHHDDVFHHITRQELPAPSSSTLRLNNPLVRRKHREILVFIFPIVFALIPVVFIVFSSPHAGSRISFDLTTHVPPIICFMLIPMYHIYMFAYRGKGKASLPFFGNIRVHWVLENCNTGELAPLNTLRDFGKISLFLAANATLAASIIVTFAYQIFNRCPNQSLSGCGPDNLYLVAQLVVLIVNFFFVIIHMLMATRFIMNCEFMLNVKEVGGRPLRPEAGRWEGGRVGGREGGREGGKEGGKEGIPRCTSLAEQLYSDFPPPPPGDYGRVARGAEESDGREGGGGAV